MQAEGENVGIPLIVSDEAIAGERSPGQVGRGDFPDVDVVIVEEDVAVGEIQGQRLGRGIAKAEGEPVKIVLGNAWSLGRPP